MDSSEILICDTGTGYLKMGKSNETFPSLIMPSLIGRPLMRYESKIKGIELKVSKILPTILLLL